MPGQISSPPLLVSVLSVIAGSRLTKMYGPPWITEDRHQLETRARAGLDHEHWVLSILYALTLFPARVLLLPLEIWEWRPVVVLVQARCSVINDKVVVSTLGLSPE